VTIDLAQETLRRADSIEFGQITPAPQRPMTQDEASRLTLNLIHRFWDQGTAHYKVKFDKASRRAGVCRFQQREIGLSVELMARRGYEDTLDTITHEIAHAIAGHAAGHGWEWQRVHKSLGGNGHRVFHVDEHDPKAMYHATCRHGKAFNRYKRITARTPKMQACNCERGGFKPANVITWTLNPARSSA
jgi:predicted SprT family Zn-dependent metalloprotease